VVGKADLGRVMISGLGHCPVLLFLPNHDLPYSLEIAGHRSSGRLPPVVIVVLWRRLLAASLAANGYPPHVIRAVPHTPLSLSLSLSLPPLRVEGLGFQGLGEWRGQGRDEMKGGSGRMRNPPSLFFFSFLFSCFIVV